MALDSAVEKIKAREGVSGSLTDGFEDISGGVTASMGTTGGDAQSATLYIATEGAVELTTEFSPDGGDTWREPADESPIVFDAAGEDVAYIDYSASMIRVTGSNTTGADLDLRVTA
jgi:hypothetical protein